MTDKKDTAKQIMDLIRKEKIQKILSYFSKNPEKRIRSSELRKEFVRYKKYIYREHGYFSPENGKKSSERPRPLYEHDSDFYRTLTKMVKYGILKKKKETTKKGMEESYYRLNKKLKNEGIRIQNKSSFNFYPQERILCADIDDESKKFIIYGLTLDVYEKNKTLINRCISNIENNIKEIERIQAEEIYKKVGEMLELLFNSTKSVKIKKLLKQREGALLGVIDGVVMANMEYINILPKYVFKKNIESWSGDYWVKEINFSSSDIEEMTEWAWKNRFNFFNLHPFSIAFSRYREYEDNDLLNI